MNNNKSLGIYNIPAELYKNRGGPLINTSHLEGREDAHRLDKEHYNTWSSVCHPEDGGSIFLWHTRTLISYVVQYPKLIPWIYQYHHLNSISSLFSCLYIVNQPPFLSTESVLHNTCQDWWCYYFSRLIKSSCINQASYCYHHSDVQTHCTLSASMEQFTFTAASCKLTPSFLPHVWVYSPGLRG